MVSGAFSSCLYWGAHLIWLCLYIYLGEAPSLHTNQNSPREIETSIRVSRGILFEHHRIHHLIWQNAAVTRFWRSFLPSSSAQSVSELSIPLQLLSKHSPAPVTQSSLFSSLRFEFIHQNFPLLSSKHAIGSTLYKYELTLFFSVFHFPGDWILIVWSLAPKSPIKLFVMLNKTLIIQASTFTLNF